MLKYVDVKCWCWEKQKYKNKTFSLYLTMQSNVLAWSYSLYLFIIWCGFFLALHHVLAPCGDVSE